MTINARIEYLINDLDMNIDSFAKGMKMERSETIRQIVKFGAKPGYDTIALISETYHVNPNWLILEKGSVYMEKLSNAALWLMIKEKDARIDLLEKTLKQIGFHQEYNTMLDGFKAQLDSFVKAAEKIPFPKAQIDRQSPLFEHSKKSKKEV